MLSQYSLLADQGHRVNFFFKSNYIPVPQMSMSKIPVIQNVIIPVCWENNKPTELLYITVIEKKVAINQQKIPRRSNTLFSFDTTQTRQKIKKKL
jgi:hypothetical protein